MITDTKARTARATGKPYKLADAGGLYLFVAAAGGKSWRFDYRLDGLRGSLTIGRYPDVGLAAAREAHQRARALVAAGQSPSQDKRDKRTQRRAAAASTLQKVADEWYSEKASTRSSTWRENVRRWFDRDVYPALGSRPIASIEERDVRELLRAMAVPRTITDKAGRVWRTGGPRTAHHARLALAQVLDHARRRGLVATNPARDARDELAGAPGVRHHRPLQPGELAEFVGAIDRYGGRDATRIAMRLLLLTFTRKRELIGARWDEVDLHDPSGPTWRVPAQRMKAGREHVVPLSRQAAALFAELQDITGGGPYCFPSLSRRDAPLSDSALNVAFKRVGFAGRVTPHGLRATASTILNGQGFDRDVVELQLAHVERDEVRASYNHADRLPDRRRMLQAWANYIDARVAGGNVVPMRRLA
jgi:integrase